MSTQPVIAVDDLRKSYDKLEAVKGIAFQVSEGEVFGLLGPNGAGKTSTVEILEGLRPRSSGSATVLGFDPDRQKQQLKQKHPDANIDHRRVPNLMVFFSRKGEVLPMTDKAADYQPGDLVTWDLGHGLTHIGIVVDRKNLWGGRYLVEHNIGSGPKIEDVLFDWKIIGHYRYLGPPVKAKSASQTAR